jgi:hypothetical protein
VIAGEAAELVLRCPIDSIYMPRKLDPFVPVQILSSFRSGAAASAPMASERVKIRMLDLIVIVV